MRLLNHYAFAVVWRHYLVWRKLVWSSLATNVANPILFLFAFGFGLGSFIDRMDGLTYLAFIVPGMVGYGAMYAASFETTIAAYSRFAMQHTWNAVLATPVTLGELLCGEILWAASKAMLSAISVLAVGGLWGGINSWAGMLMALPIVFCASMAFAAWAVGHVVCSRLRVFQLFLHILDHANVCILRRVFRDSALSRCGTVVCVVVANDASNRDDSATDSRLGSRRDSHVWSSRLHLDVDSRSILADAS